MVRLSLLLAVAALSVVNAVPLFNRQYDYDLATSETTDLYNLYTLPIYDEPQQSPEIFDDVQTTKKKCRQRPTSTISTVTDDPYYSFVDAEPTDVIEVPGYGEVVAELHDEYIYEVITVAPDVEEDDYETGTPDGYEDYYETETETPLDYYDLETETPEYYEDDEDCEEEPTETLIVSDLPSVTETYFSEEPIETDFEESSLSDFEEPTDFDYEELFESYIEPGYDDDYSPADFVEVTSIDEPGYDFDPYSPIQNDFSEFTSVYNEPGYEYDLYTDITNDFSEETEIQSDYSEVTSIDTDIPLYSEIEDPTDIEEFETIWGDEYETVEVDEATPTETETPDYEDDYIEE